ncbi:DUF4123 domain-containing protein [Bartonella sp. HY038]|uniref:DUF4123 domain-containing protein n=1 Tax=Bartonella sp. HY038 TaxID=2759660 RepID=UPI0015FDDB78|nr:DUF4123 domain-containing protein [Bartonella sp. HY038]
MASDDKRIKYSDSPFAPDWARAPEKRGDVITSFGKPIPEAEDNPHLDFGNQENSASKVKNDEAADQPFKPTVEQIEEILWQDANDDINVYCIMDGYWAEGLYGRLLTSDDISWAHMFQGDVATRNIQQAPFIIALKRGHKLTKWLIEEGWGQGWGIYFTASTHKAQLLYGNPCINDKRFLPSNEEQLKLGNLTKGPEDPLWKMRRHFRQFSDVYLESENKIVDFRYYDPNILYYMLNFMNKKFFYNFTHSINQFYAFKATNDVNYIFSNFAKEAFEFTSVYFTNECKYSKTKVISSNRDEGVISTFYTVSNKEYGKITDYLKNKYIYELRNEILKYQGNFNKFKYIIYENYFKKLKDLEKYNINNVVNLKNVIICCCAYGYDFPQNSSTALEHLLKIKEKNEYDVTIENWVELSK